MTRLDRRWWSVADAAELDVLVHELVTGYFEHRSWCREQPCPHVRAAIEALFAWRRGRRLRSIAAHFRARQDLDEWLEAA